MPLKTPVVFLIFNRPELTARVFERIAAARPEKLLVVADGPRVDRLGEKEKVAAARAIIDRVDWPCEVATNYSAENLGCKRRVSSGLSWAFEQVEEAIILEDDCVPDPTFFLYCEQLLARYRHDERIMAISGNNFQTGRRWGPDSYFFSKYFHCWGWASWRRVWKLYDVSMPTWPEFLAVGGLSQACDSLAEEDYWYRILDREYRGLIDSWAYAFMYLCLRQRGLAVLPNENLISNIGFDADATHTANCLLRLANYPTAALGELQHPDKIARRVEADRFIYGNFYDPGSALSWRRLRRTVRALVRRTLAGRRRAGHAVPLDTPPPRPLRSST